MNSKKLRVVGVTVGLALCVAAGLIVFTATERPLLAKEVATASNPEPAPASLRGLSDAFAEVAVTIKPCVVTVYSEKTVKVPRYQWPFGDDSPFRWFFGNPDDVPRPRRSQPQDYQSFTQRGMGSGVLIDKDGHILTNNHVIQDVDQIKVKLSSGVEFDATVVGTDPGTDLAVIKIKGKLPRDLAVAALGDSDALRVGDWVLAVGAPFGYEQTITAGIISAKGRRHVEEGRDHYQDFLQTDAAINPGNSGGPLVNLRGEVVGINTAIAGSVGQFAGVGFAIPINMAKPVVRDLIMSGRVTRGLLGINIQPITEDLSEHFGLSGTKGALVSNVNKGSAAEKAGINAGDAIVEYNRASIEDIDHLRNLVAATAPGAKVDIVVVRDGKRRTLSATVGEMKTEETASAGREGEEAPGMPDLGLSVAPLTPQAAKQYGHDPDAKGVLVTTVDQGSPAAEVGLQEGDLITEVNHESVANVSEFRAAVAKANKNILLLVNREGASRFVVVRLK